MSAKLSIPAALCAVLALGANGFARARDLSTQIIADPAYTHAQKRVVVEGQRRLNLYCTGAGTPTVVFESGLGDGTKAWGLVQPAIAAHARACSYDRAGLGFSDPGPHAGTAANAVADFRRLLAAAHIRPPYVLVGHSLGGMYVRLYAQSYPSEIAALVLVDPSHEDLGVGMWKLDGTFESKYLPYMSVLQRCLSARSAELIEGTELYNNCVGQPGGPRYSAAINAAELAQARRPARIKSWISEQQHIWFESSDQLRSAPADLGDIPIIVLTKEPAAASGSETQTMRDAKNALWIQLHEQIAHQSTQGVRRTVMQTGHYVQLDQPQMVIDAILEVLAVTR